MREITNPAQVITSVVIVVIMYFLFKKLTDAEAEFNVGWTAALISLLISNVLGKFIAHALFQH